MELQWRDFCCIDVPFYIVVGSTPGAPIENPGDSEGTVTLRESRTSMVSL